MALSSPIDLAPFLEHLAALPFVESVAGEESREEAGSDSHLAIVLSTPEGKETLRAEPVRTHLSYALADRLLARLREERTDPATVLLLAPYVAPPMGRHLADHGLSYLDRQGNCRLQLGGGRYSASIEGRVQPRAEASPSGWRAPSYQVLFALLARRRLLTRPVRDVALEAGVGKSTVAGVLRRLEREGFLARDRSGPRLLDLPELVDRWLQAWRDTVRPRWWVGRYRLQEEAPEALEAWVERALRGQPMRWAWGGGAALYRHLPHYRGPGTVLHVEAPEGIPRLLRALPAEDGPLELLRLPCPVGFEGTTPHTVHPLLIYSELMTSRSERAREAAETFRRESLPDLET